MSRSASQSHLANYSIGCPLLTDMSVHELATLPKLRRIGLVRVTNLTDQAIYSLADRHSTLERIHLSYCENITVIAIHFLLQNLTKLTHLSLTGIPAFRRQELQQFCRSPPRVSHYISLATCYCSLIFRLGIQYKPKGSLLCLLRERRTRSPHLPQ